MFGKEAKVRTFITPLRKRIEGFTKQQSPA